MRFRIFLLLILGHLVGDFILQFKFILNRRFSKNYKRVISGNIIHVMMHYILNSVFLLAFFLFDKSFEISKYLRISILLVFLHFCIDIVKSVLISKYPSFDNNIYVFAIDQLAHIVAMVLVLFEFNTTSLLQTVSFYIDNYPNNINLLDKYLMVLIMLLLTTHVTGIFIRKFINYINLKHVSTFINRGNIIVQSNNNDMGVDNGGFIIGILERIIILLGIAIMQPGIAGFVLTTKSIARFKKLDNNNFVEYFIIGTFLSFISAIIGGIIIHSLNIVPIIN